jgi:hypothetical protein
MQPGRLRSHVLRKEKTTMPSWIPRAEADPLVWLQNFALKFGVHVGTAGIVAGDVTLTTVP